MDEILHSVRRDAGRLWQLAQRYWFDALILAALGGTLAAAVVRQDQKDGPQGPLCTWA